MTPQPTPLRPLPKAPPAGDPPPALRHATLITRMLAEAMLMNVQRTARLNFEAADTLLAHARLPRPPAFDARSEQWLAAWRAFEVCATSADQLLGLTREHLRRSSDGLWQLAHRLLDELAQMPGARLQALAEAFATLQQAQQRQAAAADAAHAQLLALVQELHQG